MRRSRDLRNGAIHDYERPCYVCLPLVTAERLQENKEGIINVERYSLEFN